MGRLGGALGGWEDFFSSVKAVASIARDGMPTTRKRWDDRNAPTQEIVGIPTTTNRWDGHNEPTIGRAKFGST